MEGDKITHNCLTCKNQYPDGIKNDNNYFICVKLVKTQVIKKTTENIYTTEYVKEEITTNNKEETTEYNKKETTGYIKRDTTAIILITKSFEIQNIIKYDNINDFIDIINKIKYKTKEEEIEYYDSILDNIENIFTNNYNLSKLHEGEDEIKNRKNDYNINYIRKSKN